MDNKCYIVIVTFNAMPWIDRCLKSCDNYPVIVVDNNSNDNTVNYITDKFPRVHLIKSDKNVGFGVGNNIGIKEALANNACYVFLLNQDAYLSQDTIQKLIQTSKKYNKYGILSPIHYQDGFKKLDRNFSNYISNNFNDKLIVDLLNNKLKDIYTYPFVNAAGWLLTKTTIELIGGVDPLFFMYGEDDNYCQRLNYHGLKLGVVPSASMIHDRANRKSEYIKPYSSSHIKDLKKKYLYKYGNINKENYDIEYESEISRIKKLILKNAIRLKKKRVKFYIRELRLLKNLKSKIENSRTRNKITNSFIITELE